METFDPHASNKELIADTVREWFDLNLDVDVEVTVEHRGMNWYDATATHTDKRRGKMVTHYTVLIRNGRVEFQ